MTQKELLYIEDAIHHEENTIKIIDYFIDSLSSDEIVSFMQKESKKHSKIKNNLINLLEECHD